ncbi:Aldehyde dehydrogenase family 2 member C4 [Linum perenne]
MELGDQSNGKGSSTFSHLIPSVKFTKLFINGQFVDSLSGKTFDTISPRTGQVIAQVAQGDNSDVDLAVKAAREAFDNGPWPRMSGFARGRIMMKFADLMEANTEEIAALEAVDGGKLFMLGKLGDIPFGTNLLRYYAGAADKIHGDVLKMSRDHQGYTLLEPIGVVGHIVPWNFPCSLFFSKVAPSLAAGCTMVVKPAEQTPLSALFFANLAKQAGIPNGVLNVVNGLGTIAGAAISSHMDIDKVSFTGSTEVGRKIMQAAALSNLKPVSLELGGKSPVLIFDDADVDKAVDLSLLAIFYNKGEVCAAGSRVYVQEGIYEEFVKKLAHKSKEWTSGDPLDPTSRVGPQVSKSQYERVLSYIEHGKRQGATLLTGGYAASETGYYIQPTVFTDVQEDMMIAKDEIFGPVMALMKFKTIEEGIKLANNTKYGLASGIVTKSLDIANTVSRSIRAGSVWINCYHGFDLDCPFGGYKMSGFGRDFGMEALHKYLQVKSVVTPIYNSPWL